MASSKQTDIRESLAQTLKDEGSALIEMGALLQVGHISYRNAVAVVDAMVEELGRIKGELAKLANPAKEPPR